MSNITITKCDNCFNEIEEYSQTRIHISSSAGYLDIKFGLENKRINTDLDFCGVNCLTTYFNKLVLRNILKGK